MKLFPYDIQQKGRVIFSNPTHIYTANLLLGENIQPQTIDLVDLLASQCFPGKGQFQIK